MRVNFTKQFLMKCKPPVKGRIYFQDTQEKGLSVSITANGIITFFVRKRVNGKDERICLGRFPDLSIENARKKALTVKADVAKGINPNEEKKKLKQEITFGDMFREFMERYSKKQKKSWSTDERAAKRFLSDWTKRKLSHISRQEIQLLHEKIGHENGLYQANRLLERIKAIFNKAIEWGWEGTNPAQGIKKFKEKSRDRFLHPDELPRFFESLEAEENDTIRDYIYVSLFTGARRSNVLSMRWEDIHFERKEWFVSETKNGEPLRVHLIEAVIDILKNRLEKYGKREWVFEGTGVTGHLMEPKAGWKRILARANIKDLRIHDLRRTLGSWQAATGANTFIIGYALGHKNTQSTAVYARLNLDPVRDSVEKATQAMLQTIKKNGSQKDVESV